MKGTIFIPGARERFPRYVQAVERCGCVAVCSEAMEDAAPCGALLLPGGGDLNPALYGQENRGSHPWDSGRDALELALTERFLAARRPILGICRGMQVLNVALGGTLAQDFSGHDQVNGADRMHCVAAEPGSLMEQLYGGAFAVNSAHHQGVARPGCGLRVTLRSPDGRAEAVEHGTLPVLGVQWHPERLHCDLSRPGTADGAAVFARFARWIC